MNSYLIKKSRIALLAVVSVLPSCIPVDDFGQSNRPFGQGNTQTSSAQSEVGEIRQQFADQKKADIDEKKKAALALEEKKKVEELRKKQQKKEQAKPKDVPKDSEVVLPPPPPPKPKNHPVATAVPGKPGFVYSPFNNKVVEVKGIPSGTIVSDPQYPAEERMHFRVP